MRKTTDKLNVDIEEVSRTLHAEPHSFRDDFGSQNIRMALRDVADPRFEGTIVLNPEARTLTYRTLLDDFRMTNLIHVGVDEQYVRFVCRYDHIQKQLWLDSQGTMIFHRGVYEPSREQPKEEPQPETVNLEKKEESKRLKLTGAVIPRDKAKGIQIVQRKSGKKVLELLIAVKEDGQEKAKWSPLTFFDDRAEEALPYLVKQVENREPVTIVAYEREQESRTRSGEIVKTKVYYGAAVQP